MNIGNGYAIDTTGRYCKICPICGKRIEGKDLVTLFDGLQVHECCPSTLRVKYPAATKTALPISPYEELAKQLSDLRSLILMKVARSLRFDKLLKWFIREYTTGQTITLKGDPAAQPFVIMGFTDKLELILMPQGAVKIVTKEQVLSTNKGV